MEPAYDRVRMPLTLRIISPLKELLGADSTKVFSVHGGTIGRAPDNDWILPDPDRYVSAHHAVIDYQSGAYYLTDTSSNGIFVNDSDQSVGSGAPIRLHDGDRLRMGHYRFEVNIVNVGRDRTADTGIFVSDDAPAETAPAPGNTASGDAPGPVALNLELVADAPPPRSKPRRGDTEQLTIIEAAHLTPPPATTARSESGADEQPDDDCDPAAETQPVEDLRRSNLRETLLNLLRACGADPARLAAGDEDKVLGRLGLLVRASVGGLARLTAEAERPAAATDEEQRARSALAGDAPGALINDLLFDDELRDASPAATVDIALTDLLAHQVAMNRAARAAWLDLLDRMAPATLESGFSKGVTLGSLLGMSNKSKFWDLYREFYDDLARRADERFAEVFEQAYRRIYKAERERRAFRTRGGSGDGAGSG